MILVPQPVSTTRPCPRSPPRAPDRRGSAGRAARVPWRCASWPGNPRSNSVLRSTSPVTSSEPSSRKDGWRCSTISKPAPQRALARRGQFDRLAAREDDAATAPELGVDQDGHAGAPERSREPVHARGVIPVAVAEHDDVDVARDSSSRRMLSTSPSGVRPASNSTRAIRPPGDRHQCRTRARRAARRPVWPPSMKRAGSRAVNAIGARFAGPWSASSESVTLSTSIVTVSASTGSRARSSPSHGQASRRHLRARA